MNLDELQSDLQGLGAATDLDEVRSLCGQHAARMGFDTFIYALRMPARFTDSRILAVQTYPTAWTDRYFEQGYSGIDPVIAHCASHVTPVAWHQLPNPPRGAGARMMGEAGESGLRAGLTVPVHSPQGAFGVLSFAMDRSTAAARQAIAWATPRAHLLSGYLHEAVRRLAVAQSPSPTLTERERECLRWVADGKSSWEIARVLNLSERTVNFHIGRIMQKLDVCNRQHAVARATLLGLLQPSPF